MAPSLRAVIFDLDGTLVDSAVSIAAALNRVRSRRGVHAPLATEQVKQWVSLGAEELVRKALGEAYKDRERDIAEFREEYAAIETRAECLYDGVAETLEALKSAGLRLAVCSNKPQGLCTKVLSDTGIAGHFGVVLGGDAVANPKPHPGHLQAAIHAMGVGRDEAIYVGDSSIDLRASRAAGVPFLLARYGYADPALAQLIAEGFDSPKDLPALLARRMGVSPP